MNWRASAVAMAPIGGEYSRMLRNRVGMEDARAGAQSLQGLLGFALSAQDHEVVGVGSAGITDLTIAGEPLHAPVLECPVEETDDRGRESG
jgi:hypothetical protein